MATTQSHEHTQNQFLPPSPPPSPPTKRRRHKRSNSFEKLANTPLPSPPSSPKQGPVKDDEPLLTKLILTPLILTSFILSLSFINLRDRAQRVYAHSNTSFLTSLYPSSWLDPEPYQDPGDSRWCRQGSTAHVEPHDAIGPRDESASKKRRSWHLNKKIRKVARLEVSDAFEIREKVVVGMLVVMGVGLGVLGWFGMWLFRVVVG